MTTIGDSAFFGCNEITNMTISDNVTRIVSSAFASCSGLKSITFGNGMTIIGKEAFINCTSLKDLTFSGKDMATVQSMENYSWGIGSNCVIHCTDGDIAVV